MPGHQESIPILIPDGTPRILAALARIARTKTATVGCIFGENPAKEAAMTIWYMPLGCVALSADTDWASRRLQDFRVQPLCAHHTNRQDPHEQPSRDVPFDRALVASVPSELLRGSHLLVDLTVGNSSSYPQSTWAASGPHWSDTAGEGGAPLPPALELGYDMDALREFAGTDLGRLVFSGYTRLLG